MPSICEFTATESVRAGARRIALLIVENARSHAARAGENPEEAIHELRLALKQLRSLLRMIRSGVGDRFYRRYTESLRREAGRLAPSRDAVVAAHTLASMAREARGASAEAASSVQKRLTALAHLRPATHTQTAAAVRPVVKAMQQTARALAEARWRQRGWSVVAAGLRESYRRARRRSHAAHTTSRNETFHTWRTASKSLMYQVSLLRPAGPRRIKALVTGLNVLQRTLGEEHDLSVLAGRLERNRKNLGEPAAVEQTLSLINARQQRLRKQALRSGRHLFAEKPRAFVQRRQREWRAWRKR
jgi:CHAD domain-containing protein